MGVPVSKREEHLQKFRKIFNGAKNAGRYGKGLLDQAAAENGMTVLLNATPDNFPTCQDKDRLASARRSHLMDVETTGLDRDVDKIIQLACVEIFHDDDEILAIGETYEAFNDPGIPITPEISRLTGISQEDVLGHAFDSEEIAAFIGDPEMVVFHNAAFDRKFIEKHLPDIGFEKHRVDCSMNQVDWAARDVTTTKLEVLVPRMGFYYEAHNAKSDIYGLAFLLNARHDGRTAFSEMYENGCHDHLLLMPLTPRFDVKVNEGLKSLGFRFSYDGTESGGIPKSWFKQVPARADTLDGLVEDLKRIEAYGPDVDFFFDYQRFSPECRYSERYVTKDRHLSREMRDLTDFSVFADCFSITDRM